MPKDLPPPPPDGARMEGDWWEKNHGKDERPFEQVRCPVALRGPPQEKKLRNWIRARGRISDCPPGTVMEEMEKGKRMNVRDGEGNNHQAHLSALAYMSDSYFIGTVARAHNLIRFSNKKSIDKTVEGFHGSKEEKEEMKKYLEEIAREEREEQEEAGAVDDGRRIGMMVSLDHTIYFHNPRRFRADEWMLAEVETPWAGDGRGLVVQRIWSKEGVLIATCYQEGLVRLEQKRESKI